MQSSIVTDGVPGTQFLVLKRLLELNPQNFISERFNVHVEFKILLTMKPRFQNLKIYIKHGADSLAGKSEERASKGD